MESRLACRFCDIITGKYNYSEIDEPFAANKDFIAVASIGALIEGWSLVIPKTHQLSMRNIYDDPKFAVFMGAVLPSLTRRYGSLIAFEHGANKEGSITACGTDHAHLHLVPMGQSLIPELIKSGLQWAKCHPSEIAAISKGKEYLFYCDLESTETWRNPIGYFHVLEQPLSQFFRHLIASQKGMSNVSDYRRFPHLDIAAQTRRELAGLTA